MTDDQIDEETMLIEEVSDEALEAAAFVALGGFPTLPNTYCFACPSDPLRDRAIARTRSQRPLKLIEGKPRGEEGFNAGSANERSPVAN